MKRLFMKSAFCILINYDFVNGREVYLFFIKDKDDLMSDMNTNDPFGNQQWQGGTEKPQPVESFQYTAYGYNQPQPNSGKSPFFWFMCILGVIGVSAILMCGIAGVFVWSIVNEISENFDMDEDFF